MVSVRTVIVSVGVGVVVTVLASLLPARKASAVPPMAALREVAVPDTSLARSTVFGVLALVLGAAGVAYTLIAGGALIYLGLGALLVFVGVAAISPLISTPVTATVGRLLAHGLPGRLGRQNAMRNPRRTASTAAALMIGLALVSAIGVVGQSVKSSVKASIDSTIGSAFVLNATQPGFSPSVASRVALLPGVSTATPIYSGPVDIDGKQVYVNAVSAAAVDRGDLALSMRAGSGSDLGRGAVLIAEKVAADRHLTVGSTLPVGFAKGGTSSYRVAGVYDDNELAGDYLFDSSAAQRFSSPLAFAALVDLDKDASATTVRRELDRATADQATITVQDRSDFAQQVSGQVNQLIAIVYVLLALSVLIAVLGIVNTLALSVLERTRELGLLRAVGMGRRQVRRMVRVESVLIAVFGAALGIVVGVALGIALTSALKDQGVTEIAIPWLQLIVFLVLAALAGVLAAVLPGRRAAHLNVLAAIAAE